MSSYAGINCCPCCKINTCLSGDTIDTGCCLGCDDLIMWSERPSWFISQRYFLKGNLSCSPPCNNCKGPCANQGCVCGQDTQQIYRCNPEVECATETDPCPRLNCDPEAIIGKIINYNVYAEELEPLQTVYRFYKTYWRPVGFYTGGYKVHNGTNTHRRSLASQLPVAADPIQDGEFINPGLYSRCKYETIDDWDKISWWNDVFINTVMSSCLGGESPCAKSECSDYGSPCSEDEDQVYCGGFILEPNDILKDTKEGYFNYSEIKGSSNNCCYPFCDDPPCTSVSNPPFCECDSYWMTRYRRRKLLDSYRHRWGADIECYNNSLRTSSDAPVYEDVHKTNYELTYDSNMSGVILSGGKRVGPSGANGSDKFRLADHWLFNMHFERWWKIGKSENSNDPPQWWETQSFWNVPDQSGIYPNPTTTQTNYPYQVDDLVPKWWIYACSGSPVFQFEVEDAYNPMNSASTENPRNQVIDASLYELFAEFRNNNILYAEYSLQEMWNKMADAGYFEAKDWREEQLQAYQELNVRFPNAGYSSYANKTLEEMPLLGPYRKRYYADHITARGFNMRKPYLRPDLVPRSALHLQPECFIAYPGQWWTDTESNETRQQKINDYYFWAERQWVYFRAVPAGWTWASWDAQLTCPCNQLCEGGQAAPNEDAAILAGCGRAKGNCIESWFNQPNISYTENNPDNWTCKRSNSSSEECSSCVDQKYLQCLDSCKPDNFLCQQQCSDNYDQYQEDCPDCWTVVNVPQCSVAEGSSYSMSGVSFFCNSPSCLNCCAACVKTDTTQITLVIDTIKQINTENGGTTFTGPAKFRIKYTFIPDEDAPIFGGTGSGSTGLVLNESFAPSVGTKITFGFLNTNPFTDITYLTNPSITGFAGWNITSSGLGFIEIEDTYDYLEGVLNNIPLNDGGIITNGSGKNPIIPQPLGEGYVNEPTRYYCDDTTYQVPIYDENDFIIRYDTVDCEIYQNLVEGNASCPKGLLVDTNGDIIQSLEGNPSQQQGSDPNCGCSATPLVGCPSDICQKLSVTGYCGGVHITATQYATENKIEYQLDCTNVKQPVNYKYRCLWTANTFLTPAKNLYDFDQNLKKCTGATNTSMFSYWPEVKNSHVVPQKSICNPHYSAITQGECARPQDKQYLIVPACESGICWPWWEEIKCCGGVEKCGDPREGQSFATIGCLQRISCVSETHGKIWDGRNVCPPSCGNDSPSYSNYLKGGYYGKDGASGGPTESSCERNDFIGYVPSCDYKGRSVEVNS